MRIFVKAKNIYAETGILTDGGILIEDGKIIEVGSCSDKVQEAEIIDLGECSLLPGLIDTHVHGGNGCDTMDMDYNSINTISKYKISEGVTSFCPTTVTTSLEKTLDAVKSVRSAMSNGVSGAKILGAFLEGPYISEKYKGAHPQNWIREINLDEIKKLLDECGDFVCSFAVAPDKEGSEEAIAYLISQGVNVRIGHTSAKYEQAVKAVDIGANIAIHTYNAMSPFNHREVGMAGAVLLDNRIYAELICDLIHVCPEAIKILYKCKGADKIILVTDCMMAGGLADGNYKLGELDVIVTDSIARTLDGVFAGSTLRLIDGVKNMHSLGVPLEDALKMAAENPAKAIGIFDETGSIAPGKSADIIAIDESFSIKFVMVDGEVKYE